MFNKLSSPPQVLIVPKAMQKEAARLAVHMARWLEERGCVAHFASLGGDCSPYECLPVDLVVVLGGDGTMLEVARRFAGRQVPLIGINFGRVGFLAELPVDAWQEGLNTLLRGGGIVKRRMALHWRVLHGDGETSSGVAINDIVISRGDLSRVITLDVSIDGQPMGLARADGLIVSSPLGASGYAVSAGGPLVHPDIDAIIITPICPFLCNFPPVVLPHPMTVRAAVQPGARGSFLTIDGQEGVRLHSGDSVAVQGVPGAVHFATLRSATYFQRLRTRGFIQEHSGSFEQ